MRNLKNYINYAITGISGAMTADSYRRVLKSEVNNERTNELLEQTIRKSTEMMDKLEQRQVNNAEIESKLEKVKTFLENIETKTKNLGEIGDNNIKDEATKNLIVENNNFLKDSIFKANEVIDEIYKIISENNNNFINDWFTNLNSYLSSLNSIQLGIISHIFGSILTILLLWNILFAFYGDKIIIFFNLEERWPRLKKFIELRRKFQDYYIRSCSLFLMLFLIYLTYVDLLFIYYKF